MFVNIPQGYQVSLKSTHGAIDVFLCPDDSSGVCSPVTGSSPTKPNADPSLVPPHTQPTDQSLSTNSLEVGSSSPVSTSSTVTAVSQQDPSSLVLGGDAGEYSHFSVTCTRKREILCSDRGSGDGWCRGLMHGSM